MRAASLLLRRCILPENFQVIFHKFSTNSRINFNSIKKNILLKYPHLRDHKFDEFHKPFYKDCIFKLKNEKLKPAFKECFSRLFLINPEIIRRFRRVSELKQEDVLEILVGFESECENIEVEVGKVRSLWELFNLVREDVKVFESYEVMAGMLVRTGFLREVECLLREMDSKGIVLDSDEILSDLIEGYVKEGEIEKAVLIYDGVRARGRVPSATCYCVFVNLLIDKGDMQMSVRVFTEMVEVGLGLSGDATVLFENVIRLLCRNGKVQEARNLVRRIVIFGIRPSDIVLDEIVSGYCEKKDYDDLLIFFAETKSTINILLGNKVIHSLCGSFGVERANVFLQEMKNMGFIPNEVTYGIFIGWCCREHKLKSAFIFLSEIFSRSLKPNIRSYNALISGVFREGLWKHGRVILYEMDDTGVVPNLDTYKILLAGYSKARKFDEVKELIVEMVQHGFFRLSSAEDPLAKAFTLLGLDPLSVKLRRDNNVGLFKTEFYDKIGNGLYLETDINKFEQIVNGVLEDLFMPDFNSLILENCDKQNFRNAIVLFKEMADWGQELSLSAFSELVKVLCRLRSRVKTVSILLERNPNFTNELDQETLNLLVQELSKKGFLEKATSIFEGMCKRKVVVNSETYDALITGLCKKRNFSNFISCINLAKLNNWSLKYEDCNYVFSYLSKKGLLKQALELFQGTFLANPSKRLQICRDFLAALYSKGFTSVAHIVVKELQNEGFAFDLRREMELSGFSHDSVTQNAIVEGLLRENKLQEAVSLLDQMTEKAAIPDNVNYDIVIKQLSQYEKLDKAVDILNIMLKKVNIPSSSTYDELIQCCCKCLKLDLALDLLYETLDMDLTPSAKTWDVVICHVCRNGRIFEGENVLNLMVQMGEKPSREIYCSLIDRYYYEKNLSKASEYLQKMQQDGHSPDFGTHWSLISNLKNKTDENCGKSRPSFLSRLLSDSGFAPKKNFKDKIH